MTAPKKPSQEEEEYFAKEDAANRHALAKEKARQLEAAHLAELKAAHWMKCPNCGFDLEPVKFKGMTIDRCFHCQGTFLAAGELELLAGKDATHGTGLLHQIISLFKHET